MGKGGWGPCAAILALGLLVTGGAAAMALTGGRAPLPTTPWAPSEGAAVELPSAVETRGPKSVELPLPTTPWADAATFLARVPNATGSGDAYPGPSLAKDSVGSRVESSTRASREVMNLIL